MQNQRIRRFAALLFALVLVISMLPVSVLAIDAGDTPGTIIHTHNWVVDPGDQPTCTEPGVDYYTCYECQSWYDDIKPALGHAWGTIQVLTEPTCTEAGAGIQYCGRCGETLRVQIPPNGHVWSPWTITSMPSVQQVADYHRERECTVCHIREEESIEVGLSVTFNEGTAPAVIAAGNMAEMTFTITNNTEISVSIQAYAFSAANASNPGNIRIAPNESAGVTLRFPLTEADVAAGYTTQSLYVIGGAEFGDGCFAQFCSNTAWGGIEWDAQGDIEEYPEYYGDGLLPIIEKTVESKPAAGDLGYQVGEEIVFRIIVYNPSEDMVFSLDVYDPIIAGGTVIASPMLLPGEGLSIYMSHVVTESDIRDPQSLQYSNLAYYTLPGVMQYSNVVSVPLCPIDTAASLPPATLEKSLGNAPENGFYSIDDTVLFHVVFTNTTGETIYNVNVYDRGELIASAAELAPDAVLEGGIEVYITEGLAMQGSLQNIAVASYEYEEENFAVHSNIATAEFAPFGIEEDTATAVTKRVLNAPANGVFFTEGETVQYAIEIQNVGSTTWTETQIHDFRIVEDPYIYYEPVAPGAATPTAYMDYVVTAQDVAAGCIVNTAYVGVRTEDSEHMSFASSNTVTVQTGKQKDGVPSIRKYVSNSPANGSYFTPGEQIEFTVLVENNTGADINGMHIYDSVGGGAPIVLDVADGTSSGFKFFYPVTPGNARHGAISNMAGGIYTDENGVTGRVMSNSATARVGDDGPEEPQFMMSISKSETTSPANGRYYTVGETIGYSIVVTNSGKTVLENIQVHDRLATGLNGICGTIASLAPGESASFGFRHRVTQSDVDDTFVCNVASAHGEDAETGIGIHRTSDPVFSPTSEEFLLDDSAPRLTATGKEYCTRTLTADESGHLGYAVHHCSVHTAIDEKIAELVKSGTAEAWEEAAGIWSDEVYELYDRLEEQVDVTGRHIVTLEKDAFFLQMRSLKEYLLTVYAGDTAQVWKILAEEYRAQVADLCYLSGTASAEELLGTGEFRTEHTHADGCCVQHASIEPGTAEGLLHACEMHATGCDHFAKHIGGDDNVQICDLRTYWEGSLTGIETVLYRDADANTRNQILAESQNFSQWLELHEEMLAMAYEMQSEIDTAIARSYADRTILICEATGHGEAAANGEVENWGTTEIIRESVHSKDLNGDGTTKGAKPSANDRSDTDKSENPEKKSGLGVGGIVGIAVGAAAVIGAGAFVVIRKKKKD